MNYEEVKSRKRLENLEEVRRCVKEKWVVDKIKKYLEKNKYILSMSIEQVQEEIIANDMIAIAFMKDPSKQNLTEKCIAEKLRNNKNINNFVDYPSTVLLFLVNGEISNIRVDTVKSIDYFCTTNKGRNVYFTQKYTNESGGAQDNQYNDVLVFLKNTIGNEKDIFVALVEGKYYTEAKLNTLKNYERENVIVCSSEEIGERLEQL